MDTKKSWIKRHPVITGVISVVVLLIIFSSVGSSGDKGSNTVFEEGSETTAEQEGTAKPIEVIDVSTKVTEQNTVWWKYAWVLNLKNNTSQDRSVTAEIKWLDADGFVVDQATEWSLEVPANSEETFNGFSLITANVAPTIQTVEAEIK